MKNFQPGITDALFRFTRPITTAYFWRPPMAKGKLDLRIIMGATAGVGAGKKGK